MNWKVKATIQKILSQSEVGDKLNHLNAILKKDYYSKGTDYAVTQLFAKLDLLKVPAGNSALEIGTGYFLIQPIVLRLLGYNRIVTVDITHDIYFSALKKQLSFLLQDKYLLKIRDRSCLDTAQFNNLIDKAKNIRSIDHLLEQYNITYIAPYEFDDINRLDLRFDLIFSQVVLEHIEPDILTTLFTCTKNWLSDNGSIVHIVNFTDHFANPGFWCDKKISEFNFLRYSDKYWDKWAGNPIAYTNRLSYPYYFELCKKTGLEITDFIKDNYKEKKPFDPGMIHPDVLSRYDRDVDPSELVSTQRGIFVIKHRRDRG